MHEKWLASPDALNAFLSSVGAAFDGSHKYAIPPNMSIGEHVLTSMVTLRSIYPKMVSLEVTRLYSASRRGIARRKEQGHGAAS